MNRKIYLVFPLIFLYQILFAVDTPTHIIGSEKYGFKNFKLGLIIDSSQTMQIDDILERQTKALITHSQYAIPTIEANYWFILKLHNPNNTSLIQNIGLNEACFDIVDIYYQSENVWQHDQNGLIIPLNQRSIKSRWPIFEVSFEPNETKTIYLKVHSKYLVPVAVISETIPVIRNETNKQFMGYWFYFGAAISILLYNLFLFFQTRLRTYIYYVIYLFFLIVWVSLWSGFFIYISSNIKLYHILSAGVPLMSSFVILFTQDLLVINKWSKWINTVLNVFLAVLLLFFVLIIYDISFYQYLGFLGLILTIFLLFTGIYAFVKKVPLSSFYIWAMSFYLIGLFLISSLTLDLIEYSFVSRYGFMIGSFIEFILFSFALGYRLKLLQNEKIRFQKKIIENQRSMKKNLEIQVNERTKELSLTSKQLEFSNTELQNSNRSKDKLFSIIAHDLRSPFNSILGYLDILKNEYQSFTDDERKDMIDKIHVSSNNTYELLENLLVWSRTQTGGIEFNPQSILVNKLINSNINILLPLAQKKKITIAFEHRNNVEIVADKDMINLVIRNLISNAIKFTQNKGSISILCNSTNNKTIISIKDSGVGINKTMLGEIFDLSKQISTQGTNNENGTGLGLVLCKEFIDHHKGSLWVESEIGKGSTFHFSIPKKQH